MKCSWKALLKELTKVVEKTSWRLCNDSLEAQGNSTMTIIKLVEVPWPRSRGFPPVTQLEETSLMLQVDTCRQGPDFKNKNDHTKRQNMWIFGKLASWPYYVQLLICCGASWTFGEKILTVTESNLSRLQVNFTQEIQCHGGEFFQWGA